MTSSMKMIRSFDHDIHTINVRKISLSAYDDKRFIQDDGISSYAYGHHDTPTCEKQVEYSVATAKHFELSVTDDDDAWLYIPYEY